MTTIQRPKSMAVVVRNSTYPGQPVAEYSPIWIRISDEINHGLYQVDLRLGWVNGRGLAADVLSGEPQQHAVPRHYDRQREEFNLKAMIFDGAIDL